MTLLPALPNGFAWFVVVIDDVPCLGVIEIDGTREVSVTISGDLSRAVSLCVRAAQDAARQ